MKKTIGLWVSVLVFAVIMTACGSSGGGDENPPAPPPAQQTSVKLPQTGQTTCYDAAGAVISCATTTGQGQDGALQKGVAWPDPRFADNGDGTVTDNLTGLMWLKDANCIQTRDAVNVGFEFDKDGTTGDGLVTWQHALDFVAGINAGTYSSCGGGHTDWRLPNRKELRSLANYGQTNSATWLNTRGFTHVQADYYWSSTTYAAVTASAWDVHMYDGLVDGRVKSANFYVWPVRDAAITATILLPQTGQIVSYATGSIGDDGVLQKGVAWPSPRFTDNADGTITDNLTGLMWLKDANCTNTVSYNPDATGNGSVTWQHALDFVAGINAGTYPNCGGGHTDWRLPNVSELESLVDSSQSNPALPASPLFTNVQADYYWSSTTYSAATSNAWDVHMYDGLVFASNKDFSYYVWPVRGGQ